MDAKAETWCDRDEHKLFEYYVDFNEWLDSEDAASAREAYGVDGISVPSKAFYAGDKEAYDQAFKEYRENRRNEILNERYLCDQFTDNHWFERNLQRFDQLVERLEASDVVPFIGAGLSKTGGFPTWEDHLRSQGRTAGIGAPRIEDLLARGEYETIIAEIEASRGRDVFTQEIRDVFSRTGQITDITLLVTELFPDTVITTNYDRLIEQAFDTGAKDAFQVINGLNALTEPEADRVSIIKLHGDIKTPGRCVLSKNQYDEAYGNGGIDLSRPIPKLLEYYYKNSCLLFLGCSLNNDRTVQVFRAIKKEVGDIPIQHFAIEQAPETEKELSDRNAYLASLGITGIWFEKGQFEYVEEMLKLARNELRYKGVTPGSRNETPAQDGEVKQNDETVVTRFVRIFESHGVHRNQIPRFIGHDLSVRDVQDDASLLAKLDEPLLQAVCERFAINREWLDGAEKQIHPEHDFYKHPEWFADFIRDIKTTNPDSDLSGVLIAPTEQAWEADALLIIEETIAFLGKKQIYRYHLCNNWGFSYWKARAYLTACVAMAWKQKIYVHGIYMPNKKIERLAQGETMLGWQGEGIWELGHKDWDPEYMTLDPEAFLNGVDPGKNNYGIKSGLKLWLDLEKEGYMDAGLGSARHLFEQELAKNLTNSQ